MKLIYAIIVLSSLLACESDKKNEPLTPKEIIQKTIESSGSKKLDTSKISFVFRDITYKADRENGMFKLSREMNDSTDVINDELTNDSFTRKINGEAVKIPDSMAQLYSNSINSVHYFAVLPYGLDDAAVRLNYLDSVSINNKSYYKIKVSFSEEGGGTDFEDVFIYWIDKENFKIDYLAYEFHVNGGGIRFREAYNERYISGIRFVDYKNFKPMNEQLELENVDQAYLKDKLELLSTIKLEVVQVN